MNLKPRTGPIETSNPAPMMIRRLVPLIFLGLLLAAPHTVPDALGAGPPLLAQAESDEDLTSGFDDGEEEQGGKKVDDDDLSSGFDDAPEGKDAGAETAAKPSFWQLNGFLRMDGSYNYAHKAPAAGETDHRGLSKLRAALRLELSLKLGGSWKSKVSGQAFHDFAYGLNGREQYTTEVLESREQEAELREAYVAGSLLENMDLKLGRQIVVWGKSDNIQVTDVLNPVDNREPGLVDIADIRLPVTMTRLDYFFGDWRLTVLAVHEIRFSKNPVFGSDFFPFPSRPPPEVIPSDGGENTEFGLALGATLPGFDLAFYAARFFDDTPHTVLLSGNRETCFVFPGSCRLELRHSRLTMGGAAINVASGNWLWKVEGAHFSGLEFFNLPGRTLSRVDLLVGFEYSGFTDTTLSIEAVDRHLLNFDPVLENPPDGAQEDVNQYVLAYRADLLRQQLHVLAVAVFFGGEAEKGSLQRYSATYDWFEAFSVTGGVVLYSPGDGSNFLLQGAKDNDRFFLEAKYSF